MNQITARRPPAFLRQLTALRPRTDDELARFVRFALGLKVSRSSVSGLGAAPFDYLSDAFFMRGGDPVVWANRGGGKTLLGATATLLDLIFKPGIEVRILAGTRQQADRMYEHLRVLIDRPIFRDGSGLLATEPTQSRIVLHHGSRVEVLAGSPRAVRGTRVQVLRCDEVEEMDRQVWSAAQLTTRTATCGDLSVPGRIEALSTHHRSGGLMDELTSTEGASAPVPSALNRSVYRWNALDVVACCPPELSCDGCILWEDCRGRAKQASGYFDVEELMRQRRRVSDDVWESEMLCQRPSTADRVYSRFNPERHVTQLTSAALSRYPLAVGGMDLGIRGLTVILLGLAEGHGEDAKLHIVGEYAASDQTIDTNLAAATGRAVKHVWPTPASLDWLAVDPAAGQRSGQTGKADATAIRERGCRVLLPKAPLATGIEQVRRRLDHNRLTIDPACTTLIAAMKGYRFDPNKPDSKIPMKQGPDGPDHACDALRYLVVALDAGGQGVTTRTY